MAATMLALAMLGAPAQADAQTHGILSLATWAKHICEDQKQPGWKLTMARKALDNPPHSVSVFTTPYTERNDLDPTGGGTTTCWGIHVRDGLVAADHRLYPVGTVLYCPQWHRTWIVSDCGPGVKGRHIDVYRPASLWHEWPGNKRVTVYRLGNITRDQARGHDAPRKRGAR
jgi:3D (Asp-Asp-Asp) domain-containing protein